ncbi:L,D-transpeptidase [Actinomadura violacea]|uniref:L,D-transpeptidase family protein n=1 Tax=Actinomadura violacea TaxID=2819934 RepID=A0ABS3RW63_9ACTN|nr:Ig-like domain-containing protein [Actinomadura violacea]MBO2460999.1 L,D-transpeptidase family protein [Actinomadura violacea]
MAINGRPALAAAGGAGAVALLAAGCGIGGTGVLSAGESDATVTITPATGTRGVAPDAVIKVKASGGKLAKVTVQGSKGSAVTGELAGDKKTWHSTRTMTPGASYTVTAQAKSGGKLRTVTSAFTALTPARTLSISDVTPNLRGEEVGVGMPIILRFDRPVADKAAVEKVLHVTPDKPVEGAWRWIGSQEVVYRTKTYWQPHQTVQFRADLAGVNAGGGVYGAADVAETISIGAAQVTTGDIGAHRMTVTRDGRRLRTVPFSAGNGETREFTTTSGVHLLMDKGNPVTMTSPGRRPGDAGYYQQVVNYAVRFSDSGEYVHSAPWSVGSQGSANVSHGCLNVSPSDAAWFYGIAQRGDVLKLTGSTREVEWDNGWSFWQLPFAKWKEGGALG